MQNPVLYKTLARFADFNDAAKVTGLSVCEILHTINKHLGTEKELQKNMPECIREITRKTELNSVEISWEESDERYIYNNDTLEELIAKVSNLHPQENIVIISVEMPYELLKVADGLSFMFNIEKNREYRISIFNPKKEETALPWTEKKEEFDVLDVREMTSDPFDIILKKAYETDEGDGFVLVQRFEPHPMINMLSEMNFEHITEQKEDNHFCIYFHRKISNDEKTNKNVKKVEAVIQSATPVAYPVIMRLLQSEKIQKHIKIKELKVWEETEKHLAWITNGKADISFSALITSAKLRGSDIKIPALFVWDNFVLLSRSKAKSFADIKGKEIYTPLFEEAPPAKITKYLIKASGLNPDDFKLKFGLPFGRPEEIYKDFVTGKADTVILREPEASYAMFNVKDAHESISYSELWKKAGNKSGDLPNAGLIFKGEFLRKHPEIAKIFTEELEKATNWVVENKKEAAEMAFDVMKHKPEEIELFLERAHFKHTPAKDYFDEIVDYLQVLNDSEKYTKESLKGLFL
jgi:NitT/TauT family transport system substrate-binding protein